MQWPGAARCGWRGGVWMPEPRALGRGKAGGASPPGPPEDISEQKKRKRAVGLVALEAAARRVLPPGCAVAGADPLVFSPLWAGEDVAGMVPRRRVEFSSGRAAARAALAHLGMAAVAIPQGADRAPVWPEGVAGSISHSGEACLASVSRSHRGVGLDLEPDVPLPDGVHALVVGPEDRPQGDGLALFCAKEAAFKAQYPLTGAMLGPEDLVIALGGDGRFAATLARDALPLRRGAVIHGRLLRVAGHVLAGCVI